MSKPSFLTFLIPPGDKYSPEIMLLNSVSAVRSNAANGFLAPGWESVALLASYTAAVLVIGAVLLTRRDA